MARRRSKRAKGRKVDISQRRSREISKRRSSSRLEPSKHAERYVPTDRSGSLALSKQSRNSAKGATYTLPRTTKQKAVQSDGRAVAARSVRSKTAPNKNYQTEVKARKTPAELAALNRRRRQTRNSWSDQPCVKKPDSRKAGLIRQRGGGKGTNKPEPRRWC